ncbi:MAG TPA: thioredoxin domain-containing protein [Pirellulales bacterium]|nr:thioredoxin domain-containing protein [Pirellulales bacterium]
MVTLQAAVLTLAIAGAGDAVLLDFYADWCGPCRQVAGTVERLAQRGYPVRKVNIDQERELARQFRVSGIPCFVLLVDGREVSRAEGAKSLAEFEQMFQAAGIAPRTAGRSAARGQSPDPTERVQFPSTPSGEPLALAELGRPGESDPYAAANSASNQPAGNTYASTAQPTEKNQADAVARRLLAASVRLRIDDGGGNSVGSGTIIDARAGEALVLTCAHVFRDSEGKGPITIDLFGPGAPQGVPGRLVSYDLKSDVGLVSFRPGMPVVAARVAPSKYRVQENAPVINIGCNHGDTPTARFSRVTAIDKFLGPPNLVVAGQPVEGRSGGGLFTTDGLLIGVCNAADPADDEGLYAALAPIHGELGRMGLAEMCMEAADPATGNAMLADVEPPAMPDQMPAPAQDPSTAGWLPTSDARQATPESTPNPGGGLTAEESATLAEIRRRSAGAEVICIVRSLDDPRAKSEIIVLDRASPEFLNQLTADQRMQQARHLTSARLPKPLPNQPLPNKPLPSHSRLIRR